MPEELLTVQQTVVLMLLAQGSTVAGAAEAVGVHRNTVFNWRRTSPGFRRACEITQVAQGSETYLNWEEERKEKVVVVSLLPSCLEPAENSQPAVGSPAATT